MTGDFEKEKCLKCFVNTLARFEKSGWVWYNEREIEEFVLKYNRIGMWRERCREVILLYVKRIFKRRPNWSESGSSNGRKKEEKNKYNKQEEFTVKGLCEAFPLINKGLAILETINSHTERYFKVELIIKDSLRYYHEIYEE